MNDFSYFTKALDEVFENEINDYTNTLEINEPHKFSEKYNKKISKLIKRREKSYFNLICTAGRRIAFVIVALFVLSLSSLSVKAVRETVHDFFMSLFSDHTEVTANSAVTNDYPKTIQDEYEISSLPVGFELTQYTKDDLNVIAWYFNDEKYVLFSQFTKDSYIANYDNEHSELYYYTDESGQEYLIQDTGHDYTVVWDNGSYIFTLKCNLDKDTILNLCKSTKMK